MQSSIFHLERAEHFLSRISQLNRLYAPDDPVMELVALPPAAWQECLASAGTPPSPPVAQAAQVRRALHAIHRAFPQRAPLHEQAAFLLRAFATRAPLPEANTRTAWDYLAGVLEHAGHTLEATAQEGRALATSLWVDLQEQTGAPPPLDARDEAFEELAAWFRQRIA